jgi:hypothetical protein
MFAVAESKIYPLRIPFVTQKNWQGIGSFLRNLAPLVRTCLVAGMALGCLLGLYLVLGFPAEQGRASVRPQYGPGIAIPIVLGVAVLGGLIGAGAAVALERGFRENAAPDKKRKWWRGKKSSQRRS